MRATGGQRNFSSVNEVFEAVEEEIGLVGNLLGLGEVERSRILDALAPLKHDIDRGFGDKPETDRARILSMILRNLCPRAKQALDRLQSSTDTTPKIRAVAETYQLTNDELVQQLETFERTDELQDAAKKAQLRWECFIACGGVADEGQTVLKFVDQLKADQKKTVEAGGPAFSTSFAALNYYIATSGPVRR